MFNKYVWVQKKSSNNGPKVNNLKRGRSREGKKAKKRSMVGSEKTGYAPRRGWVKREKIAI